MGFIAALEGFTKAIIKAARSFNYFGSCYELLFRKYLCLV